MKEKYALYVEKMQQIADVSYAAAVLNWDEETYLPENGAGMRARQMATLSGIAHDWFTDNSLGELLKELLQSDGLGEPERKNVERTAEDYDKNKKYSADFVRERSLTTSACYHAWMTARKQNDYSVYEPALHKMVSLKQREAALLGYEDHPYNALLDEFEKGATVSTLDGVFAEVKEGLKKLLDKINQAKAVDNGLFRGNFNKDSQWQFGIELLQAMGFDFSSGRQDISEHPFTTNFNSRDVRITTRIDEHDFANMTWSCIHEGGHGLYEQGLPVEQYGLPGGEAASLAIHESQSRLWENNVGRSREFWQHFFPRLVDYFPSHFGACSLDDFYRAMNKVQPSLIRTEADEITYHFHVMIRYELEKQLISGELSTGDLRAAWNEMYRTYLGVEVPDDKSGVLQDVHWSHGSFGYFPTYSLGSFYAAQFFEAASKEIENLSGQIASGDLSTLLQWLRKHIHQYGRRYTAEALCEKITGEKLNFSYFLHYVSRKYGDVYGVSLP